MKVKYDIVEDGKFMLNDNILTSVANIPAGCYKVFIDFTINGVTTEDYTFISVGNQINAYAHFGQYNYNRNNRTYFENLEDYLWESNYSYEERTLADLKKELGDEYYEPQMYGGYKFAGWYTEEGEKISDNTIVKDTLYAKFEKEGVLL